MKGRFFTWIISASFGLGSCGFLGLQKTQRTPASLQLLDGAPSEPVPPNPYINREIKALPSFRLARPDLKLSKERVNSTYQFMLGTLFSLEGRSEEAAKAFESTKRWDEKSSHVHLSLSQEYLKKGWVTEGIELLKKAIELEPKNKAAKSLLANMLSSARKYGEAYVLLEDVIKEDPEDEESALLLVLLDIELRNPVKAEKRLKTMIQNNPDSALAYFYLGRLSQEKNKNSEAMTYYKKAIELRSGFVQAGTYLGALQENLGDKDGAMDTYSWLAGQTDSPSFHKKLGQLHLEKSQYDKALSSFENFERLEPGDLSNKIRLGLLYMQMQKPELALEMFREALQKNPDAESLRVYLANIYEQLRRDKEAIAEYSKISTKDPKVYAEALKRRLYLLGKTDPEAAKKAWSEVLAKAENEKQWSEELFTAGVLMFDAMKAYDEALLVQGLSEKQLPRNQALMYLKGMLLEKRGDWKQGIEVMQRLLELNPKHASALNFIGYVWADHGVELRKAEKYIRKAVKLRPADALIQDSLGWVLFKRKKYSEARQVLEAAHRLEPKESVIAEHLGDTLVKLQEFGEAIKFYELSLKLGPDNNQAKEHLEQKVAALRRGQPLDPCEPWGEMLARVGTHTNSECNTARLHQPALRKPTSTDKN